jgi:hypothetical protein
MSGALDELPNISILLAGTVSAMLDRRVANTANRAFRGRCWCRVLPAYDPVDAGAIRVGGFVLSPETTGVLDLEPGSPVVSLPAEFMMVLVGRRRAVIGRWCRWCPVGRE